MKEVPFRMVFAVIKAAWRFIGDLVISAERLDDERCPRDSDLFGVYNYRSGRHDDGSDPIGWYEQEWRD